MNARTIIFVIIGALILVVGGVWWFADRRQSELQTAVREVVYGPRGVRFDDLFVTYDFDRPDAPTVTIAPEFQNNAREINALAAEIADTSRLDSTQGAVEKIGAPLPQSSVEDPSIDPLPVLNN